MKGLAGPYGAFGRENLVAKPIRNELEKAADPRGSWQIWKQRWRSRFLDNAGVFSLWDWMG